MSAIALKALKVTWPYLVAAIIAGAFVGWVQQFRIDGIKATLAVKENELQDCQGANEANVATIESLKEERDSAMKGCDARIRLKEKTMANIRRIDNIQITRGETNGKDSPDSGDPLLGLLNGVFPPAEAGGKD